MENIQKEKSTYFKMDCPEEETYLLLNVLSTLLKRFSGKVISFTRLKTGEYFIIFNSTSEPFLVDLYLKSLFPKVHFKLTE